MEFLTAKFSGQNKLHKFFYLLGGILLPFFFSPNLYAQQDCQHQIDIIETALLQDPKNQSLRQELKRLMETDCSTKRSAEENQSKSTTQLSVAVGHTTNANQRTDNKTLDLTFNNQTYTFKLAEGPLSSNFASINLSHNQTFGENMEGNFWTQGTAYEESEIDSQAQYGGVLQAYAQNGWGIEGLLLEQQLYGNRVHWANVSLLKDWQSARWQLQAQMRRHPAESYLNSNTYGMSFFQLIPDGLAWAQLNKEIPQNDGFPGDGSYQLRLGLRKGGLTTSIFFQEDNEGYSPNIKNNQTRKLQRINFSYALPILTHKQTETSIVTGLTRQYSNIELFEWEEFSVKLRYQWTL